MNFISTSIISFLRNISFPVPINNFIKKTSESIIAKRIIKGSIWSIVGNLVSKGLLLVSSIIIARVVGKNSFGEFSVVYITLNTFAVFATFGMGQTATKFLAEFKDENKQRASQIIGLTFFFSAIAGIILTVILYSISSFLSKDILNNANLNNLLKIGSVYLLLISFQGAQNGVLAGFEEFKTIAKINFFAGILTFIAIILGVIFFDIDGAIAGLILGVLITIFITNSSLRKAIKKFNIKIIYDNIRKDIKLIKDFSLPSTLAGILVVPVNWICITLLANSINGYSEVAVYNAAFQWRTSLLYIPSMVSVVLLPVLADTIGKNKQLDSFRILKYSLIINGLVISFTCLLLTFFSSTIMNSYGKGFGNSELIFIVILATTILISLQIPSTQFIIASSKMWTAFFMNLGWSILVITFTILFLIKGALGIALAQLIAHFIHTCWMVGFSLKISKKELTLNHEL